MGNSDIEYLKTSEIMNLIISEYCLDIGVRTTFRTSLDGELRKEYRNKKDYILQKFRKWMRENKMLGGYEANIKKTGNEICIKKVVWEEFEKSSTWFAYVTKCRPFATNLVEKYDIYYNRISKQIEKNLLDRERKLIEKGEELENRKDKLANEEKLMLESNQEQKMNSLLRRLRELIDAVSSLHIWPIEGLDSPAYIFPEGNEFYNMDIGPRTTEGIIHEFTRIFDEMYELNSNAINAYFEDDYNFNRWDWSLELREVYRSIDYYLGRRLKSELYEKLDCEMKKVVY